MESPEYALKSECVTKSFVKKGRPALDGVNLSVKKGEAVALIGANGSGKTTLIRIFASILVPTSGRAEVCGYDTVKHSSQSKSRIGILFAGDALYDRLSGRENIMYHAALRDIGREKSAETMAKLCDILDMNSFVDKPASSYSRGMKQKTSIARAVIHHPDIMILDEPSTGLDIASGRAIRTFMTQCAEEGRTLLFSSHNAREIEECARRIVMLHEGKIVCDMLSDEFHRTYAGGVEDAYYDLTGGRL